MKTIFFGSLLFVSLTSIAQSSEFHGKVIDAKSEIPLINASLRIKDKPIGTTSDSGGFFTLPITWTTTDTLIISYVGYKTLKIRLDTKQELFQLEEEPIVLDEVTVLVKKPAKFDAKAFERTMALVKDNLYAQKTEVTNEQYNLFLSHLLNTQQDDLYKKYKPSIGEHKGSMLLFFKGYHSQHLDSKDTPYNEDYDEYPVVNITHEAAIAYCEWLTNAYQETRGKKKFANAIFRLPTLNEWQIAALGNKSFTSWIIEENNVDVYIPDNPTDEIGKTRKTIPVKGNDILYPWYGAYNYRNKPQNKRNCWMGNFKVPENTISCVKYRAGGDGYIVTGKVGTYFSNGMGLYDVVGNVAEMLNEKGKAAGGSWNHLPEESTMTSIDNYTDADGAIGFRVFMEIQR